MSQLTYENLLPILQEHNVKGSFVFCKFSTKEADQVVEAFSRIKKNEAAAPPTTDEGSGLFSRLKKGITGVISKVLGDDPDDDGTNHDFNRKEVEHAVVQAFLQISSQFYWDGERNKWLLMNHVSPFVKQTIDHPILTKREKEITARMLVELVNADGKIVDEELAFLSSFISPELGTVVDLLQRPALTDEDLSPLRSDVKETMFMLAWAVTLIDEELDVREKEKLNSFAKMLNLSMHQASNMEDVAKAYIIEHAALQSFVMEEDILDLASKIEFPAHQAKNIILSVKKIS